MAIFCKLNVLKVFPSLLVIGLSLIFSFWMLPYDYINPTSVGWVFAPVPAHYADGVGHAIQAMFFANEDWFWPIGMLTSLGPDGASIILAGVSPVLAIPAKLLETFGLIGQFWQFIGIQAVVGISISCLAVFFLAQALGASRIASVTAAILSLPLPNLFVLAIFNESLSWQFLAVIPMILLLRDNKYHQPLWPWIVLIGISVWSNTYFLIMTFPFFIAHLWVLRNRYRVSLANLVSQVMIAPWNTLSYYAIKYHVPVKTYHWLARNDSAELSRVSNLTIKMALECKWASNKIYVLQRSYIPKISRCNYQVNEVASYPGWAVFKLK